MEVQEKIAAIENAMEITLREDQRRIVESPGYPLFELMGKTRRWGKTTVAMFWTLVHEAGPIRYDVEKRMFGDMALSRADRLQMLLPKLPDPDLLFTPAASFATYKTLAHLSKQLNSHGFEFPYIAMPMTRIDFYRTLAEQEL